MDREKNRVLLFQHGWGFDADCWKPLSQHFAHERICLLDRGYFGHPRRLACDLLEEKHLFLVCHSLGVHLVPENLLRRCQGLVLIGSFHAFHGESARAGRYTRKHMARMLKDIQKDPQTLLEKFYTSCGVAERSGWHKQANVQLLADDLSFLDKHVVPVDLLSALPRTLLLHGKKDRVVPPERSRYLAEVLPLATWVEHETAGHDLPFREHAFCAEKITSFFSFS